MGFSGSCSVRSKAVGTLNDMCERGGGKVAKLEDTTEPPPKQGSASSSKDPFERSFQLITAYIQKTVDLARAIAKHARHNGDMLKLFETGGNNLKQVLTRLQDGRIKRDKSAVEAAFAVARTAIMELKADISEGRARLGNKKTFSSSYELMLAEPVSFDMYGVSGGSIKSMQIRFDANFCSLQHWHRGF